MRIETADFEDVKKSKKINNISNFYCYLVNLPRKVWNEKKITSIDNNKKHHLSYSWKYFILSFVKDNN